ncbi:MAG: methyltransferase domain-containing protein [Candidatus Aminicenantes bacterium]|nr:methyltransferase domain-containing protein [Candidatus Aminicenantes bacterium]NIM80600.1 methyltransferase domain-containing protein [Candidatus Aminicenantes bacterium]NIN19981.1 methyltransferase domain-containing protein [Candidatus Aminicenantes bacterium]NIN42609.1 methyltransferase domain-containing protein [Candidatus Aminicenantes bacterium]NIN86607.1 methyltransferase domain-containing protein [Candidatus Aminicenantes bacterium]
MKELMMDIEWESVECHLCHSRREPETVNLRGKPLVDGQFGYAVHPVICECGLVYLDPRWSKKDYDIFYKYYYDDLYRLEIKPDYGIEGVVKNMRVIWERIRSHLPGDIKNILDIGCGSGHGLKYLKEQIPGSSIFGIESSPQCCEILQSDEIGATLVTDDVESDWITEYKGFFDLIVMRHVIEHILEPIESLERIKTVLKPGGFIYTATPDMMRPRVILRDYKKWWEYWFRAVHPYYYSNETLFKTLELAGFYTGVYGNENEEIWCLANMDKGSKEPVSLEGLYRRQMEVLNKHLCLVF